MDKEENRMRCPFPRPIKEDPSEIENDGDGDCDGAWQAKDSFPKLRLVRTSKPQRQQRSNVNVRRRKITIKCQSIPHSMQINSLYFNDFVLSTENSENQTDFNTIAAADSIYG